MKRPDRPSWRKPGKAALVISIKSLTARRGQLWISFAKVWLWEKKSFSTLQK
jgi:hypothetical protein